MSRGHGNQRNKVQNLVHIEFFSTLKIYTRLTGGRYSTQASCHLPFQRRRLVIQSLPSGTLEPARLSKHRRLDSHLAPSHLGGLPAFSSVRSGVMRTLEV